MNASSVALQLPEGLTMYASTIGDILIKFAYRFQPPPAVEEEDATNHQQKPTQIKSLSILGDVTYGACCIDDLSARALGCDLLVHYGHSCLVPLTCTVIPCLYVFVEIRVDVQHLVDCVKLTFCQEEEKRQRLLIEGDGDDRSERRNRPSRIIETLVMGTVQFRSAVIESAQRLNEDPTTSSSSTSNDYDIQFQAIVPQAKPLSPGEVLGCTAPSGLATLDFEAAMSSTNSRRLRQARRNKECSAESTTIAATTTALRPSSSPEKSTSIPTRERVMIFIADGRFHLEAAMISNPTLRALRYDPYSKTLTEEKYDMVHMKKLRREAILSVRRIYGIAPNPTAADAAASTHTLDVISGRIVDSAVHNTDIIANSVLQNQLSLNHPFSKLSLSPASSDNISRPTKLFGIILGTLGRQGNPAILSRIRSLLHARGIRTITILLSEIFPKKLEVMSNTTTNGGGVCAWVQIACPRLSIDWGHYFCVPVLSPYELFVAMGEVMDTSLWKAVEEEEERQDEKVKDDDGYPMDFYSKSGGPWANYYATNSDRKVLSYGS
jgi:2-(3-amino-3-carboxypropyl)histidine synthase